MTIDVLNLLLLLVIFVLIIILALFLVSHLHLIKMDEILRYEEEKYYLDVSSEPPIKTLFPSLEDSASVSLSVIVPAYNEENRLPVMLDECFDYLESRSKNKNNFTYEVIVVNDGSSDKTTEVALSYARKYGCEKCRVLTLVKNRGKGGAVKLGVLSARGDNLLFADADGATKFSDIEKLEREMVSSINYNPMSVVIGSRAHLEKQAIASRSFFRTILMYGFHFLVWLFGVRTVRDTQCGFKLFTRDAARCIFYALHVERWAFDVELLYIAEKTKMCIKEVAVNWTEVEGSKLVPFWSWLQMGIDLVLIWLKYKTGIWKISDLKKHS